MTRRKERHCALYHRVSTRDQDETAARAELRQAAEQRGYVVTLDVEETGSGATNSRPGLERVMDAAARGRVQAVFVWKLDRFGRGTVDLLTNIRRLQDAGVEFVAVTQGMEFRGDAASRLLLTLLAAVAEFELELIRERTHLGITRARDRGVHLGRSVSEDAPDGAKVLELRARGLSWSAIVLELGCHVSAARRAARRAAAAKEGSNGAASVREET